MDITDIYSLPVAECGTDIKRQIRLVEAPQTTGEDRLVIVHTTVPPHGVSEGHTHPHSDEYILFSIPGQAVLDGKTHEVPKMGLVHARPGVVHECRNTSDSETLELYCVFVDPFEPYGIYPALIVRTQQYLEAQQ